MKRALALLMTLAVGLTVGCTSVTVGPSTSDSAGTSTSGTPSSSVCEHDWSEWQVVKEATCTEEGEQRRTCSKDGATQTEKIPAKGHTMTTDTVVATCRTEGEIKVHCSVCDYVESTEKLPVDPTNHFNPNTIKDCTLHCSACSSDSDGLDHTLAECGLPGHGNCDGLDHSQCLIRVKDNMAFTKVEGGYRFDGFSAADTSLEVYVPTYYENEFVVEIADDAFNAGAAENEEVAEWLEKVQYVYVPDSVVEIGENFACGMTALKIAYLPKTLNEWNDNSFTGVSAMETLVIPEGVASLGGNVGDQTEEAEEYALNTITIPASFTDLNCLQGFFRQSDVGTINYQGTKDAWDALVAAVTDAVYREKLETIAHLNCEYDYANVYGARKDFISAHIMTLMGCTVEKLADGYKITGLLPGDKGETLTIPATVFGTPVVAIGNSVIAAAEGSGSGDFDNVRRVVIPETVTSIGDYNFYNMPALEEVVLPEGVKSVGSQCFFGCANLTKVVIPEDAVMDVTRAPFANCPKLAEVTLPKTLEGFFGASAFAGHSEALTVNFTTSNYPNMWGYYAHDIENGADINVAYAAQLGEISEDPNTGAQYILNEDGESYTLIGFTKAIAAAYFVPETFNGKNVTTVGPAVFNARAYFKTEVSESVKGIAALIFGTGTPNGAGGTTWADNNVKYIGDYNFVGMTGLSQLRLPSSLDQKVMSHCFIDAFPGPVFVRIPRGVEELVDCFSWSGAMFNNTTNAPNTFVILPSSFKKFTNCWKNGGVATMGIVMDCVNADALDNFKVIIEASEFNYAGGGAMKAWFLNFNEAIVLGEGNAANFTYDLFLLLGF